MAGMKVLWWVTRAKTRKAQRLRRRMARVGDLQSPPGFEPSPGNLLLHMQQKIASGSDDSMPAAFPETADKAVRAPLVAPCRAMALQLFATLDITAGTTTRCGS
jgi:hypothetical protein